MTTARPSRSFPLSEPFVACHVHHKVAARTSARRLAWRRAGGKPAPAATPRRVAEPDYSESSAMDRSPAGTLDLTRGLKR